MLAAKNPHPRDERVRFVEDTHTYYIDGSSDGYLSCTTLLHRNFGDFDADAIITKMMRSPKFAIGDYVGMSREQIKAKWDRNRDEAAAAGTRMHLNIEMFYNDEPHTETGKEWELFCAFREAFPDLEPYRTEMIVFAEDVKVAGSIDMVFHDPNEPGGFIICDWKRSKQIKTENRWQNGVGAHTRDLQDTNLNHYSLQLNLYKWLLQNYYSLRVNNVFLCVLHPNQDEFLKIEGLDYYDRIEAMMRDRRAEVQRGVDRPSEKQHIGDVGEDADDKQKVAPAPAPSPAKKKARTEADVDEGDKENVPPVNGSTS